MINYKTETRYDNTIQIRLKKLIVSKLNIKE